MDKINHLFHSLCGQYLPDTEITSMFGVNRICVGRDTHGINLAFAPNAPTFESVPERMYTSILAGGSYKSEPTDADETKSSIATGTLPAMVKLPLDHTGRYSFDSDGFLNHAVRSQDFFAIDIPARIDRAAALTFLREQLSAWSKTTAALNYGMIEAYRDTKDDQHKVLRAKTVLAGSDRVTRLELFTDTIAFFEEGIKGDDQFSIKGVQLLRMPAVQIFFEKKGHADNSKGITGQSMVTISTF